MEGLHQNISGVSRGFRHQFRVGPVAGQRLLAQNVEPLFQSRNRPVTVKRVGCPYVDGVERIILQEFLVAAVGRGYVVLPGE